MAAFGIFGNGRESEVLAHWCMAVLALAWSLRLAGYLGKRMKDHGEDSRYAAARERWGKKADLYLLGFFIFQAVAAVVLAIPFLVIAYMDEGPSLVTGALAIVVWLISVIGEGTADAQLKAFKAKPENKGKVCRQGLWYYSRRELFYPAHILPSPLLPRLCMKVTRAVSLIVLLPASVDPPEPARPQPRTVWWLQIPTTLARSLFGGGHFCLGRPSLSTR